EVLDRLRLGLREIAQESVRRDERLGLSRAGARAPDERAVLAAGVEDRGAAGVVNLEIRVVGGLRDRPDVARGEVEQIEVLCLTLRHAEGDLRVRPAGVRVFVVAGVRQAWPSDLRHARLELRREV